MGRTSTCQPARTVTAEEFVDEVPPKPDPGFAKEVQALGDRGLDLELLGHLEQGDWLPSNPVEAAAALKLIYAEVWWERDRTTGLQDRMRLMQELLEKLITAVLTPGRQSEEDIADILQLKAITHIWADCRERQARELWGMRLRTKSLNATWEAKNAKSLADLTSYDNYDRQLTSGRWPSSERAD